MVMGAFASWRKRFFDVDKLGVVVVVLTLTLTFNNRTDTGTVIAPTSWHRRASFVGGGGATEPRAGPCVGKLVLFDGRCTD